MVARRLRWTSLKREQPELLFLVIFVSFGFVSWIRSRIRFQILVDFVKSHVTRDKCFIFETRSFFLLFVLYSLFCFLFFFVDGKV